MRKHLFMALLAPIIFLTNSCSIDEPTFPFQIVVESEDGTRIQNALVSCTVPLPNSNVRTYEGYTGVAGTISFEHTGGEVVLQVQATKGESPLLATGCGFIKLEPDEKVRATIVVSAYDPNDPGCQ